MTMTRAQRRRARKALKHLGRLEVRDPAAAVPPYSRAEFGHGWDDDDRDGQNARAEVLIDRHRPGPDKAALAFATSRERRVVGGRWMCRFSGDWVTDGTALDIDHLVPLAEAWESGAHAWAKARRVRYSNGRSLVPWKRPWLIPVTASLNRSKGAKRPDQWLPPHSKYHPIYAADWVEAKRHWGLSVLPSEAAVLRRLLEGSGS